MLWAGIFFQMQIITVGFIFKWCKLDLHFPIHDTKIGLCFISATNWTFLSRLCGLGTTSVFVINVCSLGGATKNKSVQLILAHLVFTNILTLVSKGIPNTIAAFGVRNFLSDIGCKIVCYLERWPGASPSAPVVPWWWSRLQPSVPEILSGGDTSRGLCGTSFLWFCFLGILMVW